MLNGKTELFALIAFVVLGAIAVTLMAVNKRLKRKQLQSVSASSGASWKAYLKFQGIVLCGFLFLGVSLGWVSVFFSPLKGQIKKGGKLIEYRNLDLSQHPVYEELDIENYSTITIMTKTIAPENSEAILMIYGNGGATDKNEITHLESSASSWSQWDQTNPTKHISLSIKKSERPGIIPATQADVLVYLSSR
jgi:hypothetical protein